MPEYRIYCLDGNGRVARRIDLECDSDGEAWRKAHEHCSASAVEVWSGRRRLFVIGKGSKLPPAD